MNGRASFTRVARLLVIGASPTLFVGCAEEPPPPGVNDFLDNRILLEATIVRCRENRSQLKYEAECLNAREATNRIAAADAAERREQLEAQSERKRQALRRAQEAAAEARRRAAEAERLRREAELMGQPPETPPPAAADDAETNVPEATRSEPLPPASDHAPTSGSDAEAPAEPPPDGGSDLDAVREELRRRQEEDGQL